MSKLYEYVDRTIKRTTIDINNRIKKVFNDNVEDLAFEDTRSKTKLKVENSIKNILLLEFKKLFNLGQIHGIKSVQDLDKVKETKKTTELLTPKDINKKNTFSFSSSLGNLAEFSEDLERSRKIVEDREKRLRIVNRKEKEGRVMLRPPINDSRDFRNEKGEVIPTPIEKLKNFNWYLGKRQATFGSDITSKFANLIPSYPKEIRNKFIKGGTGREVKLRLEQSTSEYIKDVTTGDKSKSIVSKESNYIFKIRELIGVINNKLERRVWKLEDKLYDTTDYIEKKKIVNQLSKTSLKLEIADKELDSKLNQVAITELRAAYGIGRILSYVKMGIKYVKWSAEPEHLVPKNSKTKKLIICNRCKSMDGVNVSIQVILSSSFILSRSGEKIQPFLPNHPYCACVYLPVKKDLEKEKAVVITDKGELDDLLDDDLTDKNNKLLAKAIGVISVVSSIGFLAYALRKDIKHFIESGLMTPSVNLAKTEVVDNNIEGQLDDQYNLSNLLPNLKSKLSKLESLSKDPEIEEVLDVIEQIAPTEGKKYIEVFKVIEEEELTIQDAIFNENDLLDINANKLNEITLLLSQGGDITTSLSELVRMKASIEQEISKLENFRFKYSNESSLATQSESDLETVLDAYFNEHKVSEKVRKHFESVLNRAKRLEQSSNNINEDITRTINKLKQQRKEANNMLLTVKNKDIKQAVADELDSSLFGKVKRVSGEETLALQRAVRKYTEELQRVRHIFDKNFSTKKLNSLVRELNTLKEGNRSLTLKEYRVFKEKVNSLKVELDKLESLLAKYKEIDLEFVKSNTSSTSLKQLYTEANYYKSKYMETKSLIYDLDYEVERVRRIQNKSGTIEHIDNLNRKVKIIESLKTKKGIIYNLVARILPKTDVRLVDVRLKLLLEEIGNIDKSVNLKDKTTKLRVIERKLQEIENYTLNKINSPLENRYIKDLFKEFRDLYINLRKGYDNLEFKRDSNVAEFSRESIIEKEQLYKMISYVRKFPTKYNRYYRLF